MRGAPLRARARSRMRQHTASASWDAWYRHVGPPGKKTESRRIQSARERLRHSRGPETGGDLAAPSSQPAEHLRKDNRTCSGWRALTFMMCGKRKSTPVWKPQPRPTEDTVPRPTHQTTNFTTCLACPRAHMSANHGHERGRKKTDARKKGLKIPPPVSGSGHSGTSLLIRTIGHDLWSHGNSDAACVCLLRLMPKPASPSFATSGRHTTRAKSTPPARLPSFHSHHTDWLPCAPLPQHPAKKRPKKKTRTKHKHN